MQHAELRCKGGVGSKVGWSKALNKTVDYRVDSQAKVGMRERGFKEEGIREEMETGSLELREWELGIWGEAIAGGSREADQ